MRILSVLAALSTLVGTPALAGVTATKPARETVPILLPVVADAEPDEARELAIAIQTFTSAALVESGRYNEVHLKQVLRMAELEGIAKGDLADPAIARKAARHLGASGDEPKVVSSRLERAKKGWTLTFLYSGAKKPKPEKVELPADPRAAVERAASAIMKALGAKHPGKGDGAIAGTRSADAMRAFATCWSILVVQPMGVENPAVLRREETARAVDACKAAITADGSFAWAHAALGLGLAIRGDDEDAVRELAPLKTETRYLPPYWIARFWLVTRHQSNDAGAGVLREAIGRHPGFLLARGYLGELLDTLHDYAAAEAAWLDYAAAAPESSFARANLSFTRSKLHRYPEAIALAQEALTRDPESRVLKWELAGRFLDAGMVKWAIDLLKPLAERPDASNELLLRLGEAYFDAGMLDDAKRFTSLALERAAKADERRIRRHAMYRLAKIALVAGQEKECEALVRRAAGEGFKPDSRARKDPALMAIVKRVEAETASVRAPAEPAKLVASTSTTTVPAPGPGKVLVLDDAGELKPVDKAPPPSNFELIRF
ncbi:tetratricopeptide repeat protein [Myxococcota bacterium]|nr:tetratricopeptide repeat protein [Myxococcota bacterium]